MENKYSKLATATVSIDGLAICCYTRNPVPPGPPIWDIAFLRVKEPKHFFTLEIDGKRVDVDGAKLITIVPVNQKMEGNGQLPAGGCSDLGQVDRHGSENPDRMRWALDLNNSRDVGQDDLEFQKPSCGITRLQITGAVFRCAALFPQELKENPKDMYRVPLGKDPNKIPPDELRKYRFGKISDLLACDICSSEKLSLTIDIDGSTTPYSVKPGKTLNIRFENMDRKPHLSDVQSDELFKGDFHLYYDAVANAQRKYALWGPLRPSVGDKLRDSFRTDCNAVWLSEAENIDELF